ncbi:MAG: ribonucleoside-diphosphate reductase subunit alpha [Candidatus Pacebacteria bacterium]|nr:ribonucleoside-diphosphate reductase subunit alpha [Candidatus Paceibacterota bacterium]MDD3729339.1 ribonucleoside-diphosphate reductase subunit alpha [Candidatus Paceibacterota bacterium]MDD4201514.1 ribonucleoside-diphosphate reductase subunit alpha [Candidatus Paceibacterota bacterium]MDD4897413.1 ribonucleoside-diphosphate reductase subunit alpha [Candidatus Paceibacterota bacterium]MDD5446104.1 ribonucleoside-diphosphate reductase subunit alpha [Candidatus Paceibacterota bacterium]
MNWLNDYSKIFLSKGYLNKKVSAEERIDEIAKTAENILNKKGFAKKFYKYMSEGYYSLSSPVWSNFGLSKGFPISCFSSYLGDDMGQILFTQAEVGMMSKYGGGTAGYFGDLRPRGSVIKDNGFSSGAVHFMHLFETLVNVVSQGSVRRGHFAPYLPVEHSDIEEFLNIGTEGNFIQEMTYGVTVTDKWLKEMISGDSKKRDIWAKILQRRTQIGYPYIFFTDNVNKNTADVYKDKKLKILASNLCSEILLPSNEKWSFVCNLSSLNLLHYEKWKNTDVVETLVYFLDAVMSDFIKRLEKMRDSDDPQKRQSFLFMERAYNFAVENRAIGIGVLGWHSLLQSKMLPIDSDISNKLNVEIFKNIKEQSYEASKKLAKEYGEPPILKGYGRRNSTLMAIAPTTSSAFILGQVSQSIEPIWSNCYVKDIDKMKVTIKNKELEKLLEKKGENSKETWKSIRDNDGSVLHLPFLSKEEKEVFKTFQETDQRVIIEQAAVRQKYIDQGQSLNLAINPSLPVKEINSLYIDAWKMGIKTFYYQYSVNAAQQFGRMKDAQICKSCEA